MTEVTSFWKKEDIIHFAKLEELNGFAHVAIQVLDFIETNLRKQRKIKYFTNMVDLDLVKSLHASIIIEIEKQINEDLSMKNSKNYNRKANKFYNDIMEYFGENVFYEDEEERKAFETAMKGVLKDIK